MTTPALTKLEMERKLKHIELLTADGLRGWRDAVIEYREYFPGERAALVARAKKLGVSI